MNSEQRTIKSKKDGAELSDRMVRHSKTGAAPVPAAEQIKGLCPKCKKDPAVRTQIHEGVEFFRCMYCGYRWRVEQDQGVRDKD